jgi:alkanesulfonate monooxygenase SsuD/methylene tetrahydromethanopterin reductase-like flavin-dependent oxidoreductase (luciferase family)
MKLSIAVTNYSWPGGSRGLAGHLVELARDADTAGVDTLWVADHLLQMDPNSAVDEPMLEAYTTLGFLAAVTDRVRLGTLVTWAAIRPPALVVKTVSTLDVLSGGRAWLGVGAGYQEQEAAMTGLPFQPTAERFVLLEELLQLAAQLWDGNAAPFDGPRHPATAPINQPAPINRPRVLVGGMGEQRTLPLVARYADACNLFDIPDGGRTLRGKLDALRAACEEIGRDPASVEVTLSTRVGAGETPAALADRRAALGVDHVIVLTTGPWEHGGDLDVALASVDPLRDVAAGAARAGAR